MKKHKPFRVDIKSNKGSSTIEFLFIFASVIALILCFIAIPPIYFKYQNLSHMTNEIVKAVEETGEINPEIELLISEFKAETKLNPSVRWEGNFRPRGISSRIQKREVFYLTLSDTIEVTLAEPSFSGPIVISIPISKRVKGISEVYWKPGEL